MAVANREFGSNIVDLTWDGKNYRYIFTTFDVELTATMMRSRAAQDIINPAIQGWDFPLVKDRSMTIDLKGVVRADRDINDFQFGLFESAIQWTIDVSDGGDGFIEAAFLISSGYGSISGLAIVSSAELNYGGEAGEGSLRLLVSGIPIIGLVV